MRNFDFVNATTTGDALARLSAQPGRSKLFAGGTDLLDELKEGLIAPAELVNIKPIADLDYLRNEPGGLRIGALTRLSALQENARAMETFPALRAALDVLASPQIRNMATVGGNLCQRPRCWYYRDEALFCRRKGGPICYSVNGENTYHAILGGHQCYIVHPSDLAPVMMAYRASVTINGPRGRQTMPLAEFFIGPETDITRENVLAADEMVEEVSLPAPDAGSRGVFLKVRERGSWDFATVSVSAVLTMDGDRCRDARVVLGAVAPKPWPVPNADAMLTGKRITAKLAGRAAEAAVEGAKPMTMNGYKVIMARNLVRRAILTAAGLES